MKDIGKLEHRIERLEETTTLNLLEIDTKHFQVLDSAGNDRTKSGFFVDTFKDHFGTEANPSSGHRSAIDMHLQEVRPMTKEEHIRMMYDSATSVNTIRKGDNVYIKYDEEAYIDQTTASKGIKINPFAVTIYDGSIVLSPSSDEWRDVERVPDKIIPGGQLLSPISAYHFDDHIWNWCGNTGKYALNRVVSDESILNLIEDRTIETALAHFMRSRKVFFKAEGLRPNTRVFTFLDGHNISNLTNGTSGDTAFMFYSSTDSDFGNTLKNVTTHPDGASTLVTDADGRISGSFIVPNNDNVRIRTGTREFKILDISVNNEGDAGTISSTPYTAEGFLDTKQAIYHSTRVIVNNSGTLQYVDGGGGDGAAGKGTTIHALGSFFSGDTRDVINIDDFGTHPSLNNNNTKSSTMNFNKKHGSVGYYGIEAIVGPYNYEKALQEKIKQTKALDTVFQMLNKNKSNNTTQDDGWSTTTGYGSQEHGHPSSYGT